MSKWRPLGAQAAAEPSDRRDRRLASSKLAWCNQNTGSAGEVARLDMVPPTHTCTPSRQCASACGAGRSPWVPLQSRKMLKPSIVTTHLGCLPVFEWACGERTSPGAPVHGRNILSPSTTDSQSAAGGSRLRGALPLAAPPPSATGEGSSVPGAACSVGMVSTGSGGGSSCGGATADPGAASAFARTDGKVLTGGGLRPSHVR